MKSTGIVRVIDDLGRFVVPKELRDTLGMDIATAVEVFVDGEQIMLRRYEPGCTFCGEVKHTRLFMNKRVCAPCIHKLINPLNKEG